MNRRQLLLQGALLAALAPVVRAAGITANTTPTGLQEAAGDDASSLLVVHDPAYRRSREFAAALHSRGALRFALEPDALAAWHASLRAACAASPSLRMVGLTTHTDYLVLRDLARTAGLVPLATRDADAGAAHRRATLIAWVLAPRATVS